MITPAPFDQAFLDELLYDPSVLMLDRIEELDVEAKRIVCRWPTDRPMPLTDAQRVCGQLHPRHVSGGVMVHVTAMLGFAHVYYLHGLRRSDGWTGYGTNIHRAAFRKLVEPGLPLICSCTELRARRMPGRMYCTYRYEFRHDGALAYESEQSAMWLRPDSSAPASR